MGQVTFEITLHTDTFNDDELTSVNVASILDNRLPGYMWRSTVKVFNPDNYRTMNKIPAIKVVREALKVGLAEAKLIVDTAQANGECRWMNVLVKYVSSTNGNEFQVIVS